MSKLNAWIKAIRIRTLPLSLSGIVIGSFTAYAHGFWNTSIFLLAISTTLFLQILSNLANDLGDGLKGTDNEHRIGPKRAIQSGIISIREMKIAIVILVLLALASAIPLIFIGTKDMPPPILWIYIALAIAGIIAAITYTVGKKAYGYLGLGDFFVLVFFGFVSVLGVYSLYSKRFDVKLILLGLTIGLLSMAVLNLNNMRDHVNDRNAGKKTLVVKMGFDTSKIYHSLLILIAFCSYLFFVLIEKNYFLFIGGIPFIFLVIHLKKVWKTTNPALLDPELKKVALSTFIISLLYSISAVLWS